MVFGSDHSNSEAEALLEKPCRPGGFGRVFEQNVSHFVTIT
jgi:hypothetical protein